MYKIEKNIPLKSRKTRWSDIATEMKEGDSIVLTSDNDATGLRWALKRRGKSVITRTESEGIRVYCTGENQ